MKAYLLTLPLFIPSLSLATTPTISNVTGTVNTGQTLTVTGANMVDLNQTNWKSGTGDADSWSFEGDSPEADGWVPLHRSTPDRCTYGYSTTAKLIGAKSMWMRNTGAYDGSSMGECYVTDPYAEFNRSNYYGAFYFRYNQNAWPDSHQKLYLGCCDGGQIYIQPSAGDGSLTAIEGTAPTHWYVRESGGLDLVTPQPANPSGALVNDKWYFLEFHVSASRIEVWVDDAKIVDVANTGLSTNDYPGVGIPNVSGTPSNWDATINVDYFVHSNSRVYPASKIEIANSQTYATATRVYQEPIALSDGSVQIKANLTGLGAGPYYLFVTNNRQEVSSAYALDGSAPPPTTGTSIGVGTMPISAGTTTITVQ